MRTYFASEPFYITLTSVPYYTSNSAIDFTNVTKLSLMVREGSYSYSLYTAFTDEPLTTKAEIKEQAYHISSKITKATYEIIDIDVSSITGYKYINFATGAWDGSSKLTFYSVVLEK